MSQGPPPLPTTRAIKCARFESSKSGAITAGRDRRMIEEAQDQAREWLDQNPDLEIVSIDTACGRMLTVVTVWYR